MPIPEDSVVRIEPDEFVFLYDLLREHVLSLNTLLDEEPLTSLEREEVLNEKKTAQRLSRKIRKFLIAQGMNPDEP